MRRAVRQLRVASFRTGPHPAFSRCYDARFVGRLSSTAAAQHPDDHVLKESPKLTNSVYADLIRENTDSKVGSAASVASILKEVEEAGLVPDSNVCHTAVRALAVHPDPLLLSAVSEFMRDSWLALTEAGWHDLVAGQFKNAQLEEAMENLEAMRTSNFQRRPWLLDMAVLALCDRAEIDEALELMQDRVRRGETDISQATWYYLFEAACLAQHYHAVTFLWGYQVDTNILNPTSGQCLAVLQLAAQQADVPLATAVFSILSRRATSNPLSSIHYELLMDTYLAVDDIGTPLRILNIMSTAGLEVTRGSTHGLYQNLIEGGSEQIKRAVHILHQLYQAQPSRPVSPAVMNIVLEATIDVGPGFANDGGHSRPRQSRQPLTPLDVGDDPCDADLKLALHRFEQMAPICEAAGGPTRATYHLLLRRCAQAPVHKDAAVFLADEMAGRSIAPDATTVDLLASTCAADAVRLWRAIDVAGRQEQRILQHEKQMRSDAANSYEDAWRYYTDMKKHNWAATQSTMDRMIQACRERRDDRLSTLMKDLENKPSSA